LAILARHHGIRFMVAAPTSTIDWGIADGSAIPIEDRAPGEVLACGGAPHRRQAVDGLADADGDVLPAFVPAAVAPEDLAPYRQHAG
ncbi:S-methyl-5-thioribose-1-phosphate isomerase, partial [Citrobacter sp. AAK_AS5]